MPESLSILIPTHNRAEILTRTLESLSQIDLSKGVEAELIVVANACTDNTETVVAEWAPKMRISTRCVVEHEPGLSVARNRGIAEARGDILAFLDDDVWVEPNWLIALVQAFSQLDADVLGGKVRLWWEAVEAPGWFDPLLASLLSENDRGESPERLDGPAGIIGANFAVRRRVIDRIGLFRKDLGRSRTSLTAGEETDFVQRAIAAGFRVYYAPGPRVKHWVAPHRLELAYLCGVARGTAIGRQLLRPRLSSILLLRILLGNTYLIALHSLAAPLARLIGDRRTYIIHRVMRATGVGGLIGLKNRLLHPLAQQPPSA